MADAPRQRARSTMAGTLAAVLVGLGIALGGGFASAWHTVENWPGFGKLSVGPWTAQPGIGSAADPYAKAWAARLGGIPLGSTDGVAFSAPGDSAGRPLSPQCTYRIEGQFPAARLWTLHIADPSGIALVREQGFPSELHSRGVLRAPDGSVVIRVGPSPRPGNWIRSVGGSGAIQLVLTFYDTSVADGSGLTEITMPTVIREGCRA